MVTKNVSISPIKMCVILLTVCLLSLFSMLRPPANAFVPAQAVIHFSPDENLEDGDIEFINEAKHTLDMAAYLLTDWPIMTALMKAADRGVVVRILLDGSELDKEQSSRAFKMLVASRGVTIKVKHERELLHLKSMASDGRFLRTGSANFSPSGLKRQDNDIILLESTEATAAFTHKFENLFLTADTLEQAAMRGLPPGSIPRW